MPSGWPGAVRTGTETEIPQRSAHLLRLQRDGEGGAANLTPAPLPQGWRCPGPSPAPAAQVDQLLVFSHRKIPQTAAAEPPSRRRWVSWSPCSCCCSWACLPGRSLKSTPTPHAASEHHPPPAPGLPAFPLLPAPHFTPEILTPPSPKDLNCTRPESLGVGSHRRVPQAFGPQVTTAAELSKCPQTPHSHWTHPSPGLEQGSHSTGAKPGLTAGAAQGRGAFVWEN